MAKNKMKPSATNKAKPTAENKTKPTAVNVEEYIRSIKEEQKRKDSKVVLDMMKKISGEKPVLWGASLIGFGHILVTSPATGRTVEWFKMGFAPRKDNLSLYMGLNLAKHAAALKKLGKHKTGVGCLYINKLDDIDLKVLEGMLKSSLKDG